MRLYHSRVLAFVILVVLATGCSGPKAVQAAVDFQVTADGQTIDVKAPAGSSPQQVLEIAKISLGSLDRVEPLNSAPLAAGASIRVVRVEEKFEVHQEMIPFVQQRQPTELLPEGEMRLDPLQPGEAGLQEITYRVVYEDGAEVSKTQVKAEDVKEQKPQIMLVGVKPLFSPFSIPGRLVYLVAGNAWVMEETTGNRRPLVTTGDLDGRVFSVSSDGSWLLFTRRSEEPEEINSLWAAEIVAEPQTDELLDLKVPNVVHFADWIPGSNNRVAYSTVEPRLAAPGWQSNNDLNYLTIYQSGSGSFVTVEFMETIGGSYGWWGVDYAWAPDGKKLAYSNSNGVGLIGTTKEETPKKLLEFNPLQTRSDWAWIPGVAWAPDGKILYTVDHAAQPGNPSADESQLFNLSAVPVEGGGSIPLASNVGMFAYPVASPAQSLLSSESAYQVAYLQALFPTQSESSPYRLMVMDRDGSNLRPLFPAEGEPGLVPQQVIWSPEPFFESGGHAIALIYGGNLWMVDVVSGQAHQITGDQMVSRIVWRGK